MPQKKSKRYAWIKNPHGIVLDIPEAQVAETLKRKGFEFVSWNDDKTKELDKLFGGVEVGAEDRNEKPVGSYQSNVHGHGPDKEYVPSTDGARGPDEEIIADDTEPLSDEDIELLAGDKEPDIKVNEGLEGIPSPTEKAQKGHKTAKKATPAKGKGGSKKAK